MYTLTRDRVLEIMPLSANVLDAWLPGLQQAMNAYAIDTPVRVAMFLANVAHESAELTKLEEDLRYTAPRLLAVWPHRFDAASAASYAAAGPAAIASYVYANRLGNGDEASGDGWLYRGRGPNGLTFRGNYAKCSADTVGDDTLVQHPEYVMDPDFGAATAGWVWATHGCNTYADQNDFDGVCDCINIGHKTLTPGDSNGYAQRVEYWQRAQLAIR